VCSYPQIVGGNCTQSRSGGYSAPLIEPAAPVTAAAADEVAPLTLLLTAFVAPVTAPLTLLVTGVAVLLVVLGPVVLGLLVLGLLVLGLLVLGLLVLGLLVLGLVEAAVLLVAPESLPPFVVPELLPLLAGAAVLVGVGVLLVLLADAVPGLVLVLPPTALATA
jgi:hypothetical protein